MNPAGFHTFPLQEEKCKGGSEDLHLILTIAFQQPPMTPTKAAWCLGSPLRHPPGPEEEVGPYSSQPQAGQLPPLQGPALPAMPNKWPLFQDGARDPRDQRLQLVGPEELWETFAQDRALNPSLTALVNLGLQC